MKEAKEVKEDRKGGRIGGDDGEVEGERGGGRRFALISDVSVI